MRKHCKLGNAAPPFLRVGTHTTPYGKRKRVSGNEINVLGKPRHPTRGTLKNPQLLKKTCFIVDTASTVNENNL